jgi:putative transposase
VAIGHFGVNRITALLGLSKATYYLCQNPVDKFETKYLNIKSFVTKVIEDNSAYGVDRIKAELEEKYAIKVGRDTLGKLLKLWRLSLKRKVIRRPPNLIQKILLSLAGKANLLIRTTLTAPFEAITSDITELFYRGGKAYLAVHKDAYGQMVYGFSLSLTMDTGLVLKSLAMTRITIRSLIGRLATKPLYHQDRGTQYTSHAYVQAILVNGVISYSNPGTPTHNPGQESFFGRFKDEWKGEIAEIETFEKLEKFVRDKINYYNNERRHTSIGLIAPRTFTKSFLKNRR